jgi:hypothetical protein
MKRLKGTTSYKTRKIKEVLQKREEGTSERRVVRLAPT